MEEKPKKKKVFSIVALVLVTILVISLGTYALWQITRKQQDRNVVGSTCLNVTFGSESNDIDLQNAWPTSDSDGANLTPYTFTITNTCTTSVNYSIALESIAAGNGDSNAYLSYDYIRVKLDDDEPASYGSLTALTNDTPSTYTVRDTKEIAHHTLPGGESETHYVRLWVDENTPLQNQDESYNTEKYFYGKIKIVAGQNIEGDDVIVLEPTDEACFTINKNNNAITGYDVSCGGTDVVIPSEINGVEITKIDYRVFASKGLTSVYIPSTVTEIGSLAFANNQLTSVIIPASVTTIGSASGSDFGAFEGNNLESVTFENTVDNPSQLTTIRGGAFMGNDITNVVIPASVTTIDPYAFAGNELETLTFENTAAKPSQINTIGEGAFAYNKLESLVIPESVRTLGKGSFFSNNLTEVDIKEGLTALGTSTGSSIDQFYGAFGNNKITSISLPSTLISIGGSAFMDNRIASLSIPTNVTTINTYAFAGNNITNLTIPAGVTTISNYAFKGNSLFTADDVTIEGTSTRFDSGWATKGFPSKSLLTNECYAYTKTSTSATIVKYNPECGQQVEIPSQLDGKTVKKLDAYSFQGCNLTSVTIPSGVTTIGVNAFQNNSLTSITLPSGLTKIDNFVFQHNQLSSVTIPASVTTIGVAAFQDNQLTSLTIPTTVTSMSSRAFADNLLQSLTIESGTALTSIPKEAFANNNLTSITIPEGITTIGVINGNDTDITEVGAFANNNIQNVSFPSTLTSIGSGTFYNNSLSGTINLVGYNSIGDYAFQKNPDLSKIIVSFLSDASFWNGTAEVEIVSGD